MEDLYLKDLQVSQFYVSEEKLKAVQAWLDPDDLSNFEPVPVKMLDGIPVMTDGHTRALAAVLAGLERIPLTEETDELSWEMYRICVQEAHKRGVHTPYDLRDRILSAEAYKEKWDAWCDALHASLYSE